MPVLRTEASKDVLAGKVSSADAAPEKAKEKSSVPALAAAAAFGAAAVAVPTAIIAGKDAPTGA